MGGTHETPSNSDLEAPAPPAAHDTKHYASADDSVTVATDMSPSSSNSPSFFMPPAEPTPLRSSREPIKECPVGAFNEMLPQATSPSITNFEVNNVAGEDSKAPFKDNLGSLKHRTCRKHRRQPFPSPSKPGAVAVQEMKTIESEIHLEDVNDIAEEEVDAEAPHQESDKSSSFIVSAHLVVDDPDSFPENYDTRIRVVAEVIKLNPDDGTLLSSRASEKVPRKICGMTTSRTCKIALFLTIFLVLPVGIALGVTWSVRGSFGSRHNTEPRQALIQELETWIVRNDEDKLSFQNPSSPQSQALDWLLTDDITRASGRSSMTVLERYVLAVLYFATGGPHWARHDLNFLTQANVCQWNNKKPAKNSEAVGIYCLEKSSVQLLLLSFDIVLAGTIPWELSLLFDLEELNFYGNALTGSIPNELGDLTSLVYLSLSVNSLVGTLPTELGRMTALRTLEVFGNQLTGTIPTELGELTSVWTVHLENNDFTGTLPTELSRWDFDRLRVFVFSGNEFTGSVDALLCSRGIIDWAWLESDCLTTTNGKGEIECSCCTTCCDANGQHCQQPGA